MYNFGDKLPNGATVIHSTNEYVLAHCSKGNCEWIVWRLTHDGHTISGCYTPSLQRAVEIWIERTGECI